MIKYHVLHSHREVELPEEIVRYFEANCDDVDDRKLSYLAYVAGNICVNLRKSILQN